MTAAEESTNNIIMDTTGAEFIPVAIQKVAITGCIKRPITKLLHTLVKTTVRIMIITAKAEAGTFWSTGISTVFKNADTPVLSLVSAFPSRIAEAIRK